MKKQTAANNEFLALTKKIFSSKFYKEINRIYNTEGQQKAEDYINIYWNWEGLKKNFANL